MKDNQEEQLTEQDISEFNKAVEGMIDSCMTEEDSLGCILEAIEIIPTLEGLSKPRLVLFTQPDCAPCADAKAQLKPYLDRGAIQEIDANTEEGTRIMDLNNLPSTPTLAVLGPRDKVIAELELEEKG